MYSLNCTHDNLKRLSATSIICTQCGERMINSLYQPVNKRVNDFKENNYVPTDNFDRHFSNDVSMHIDKSIIRYADVNEFNIVTVNWSDVIHNPNVKYRTIINGKRFILSKTEIYDILNRINAKKK